MLFQGRRLPAAQRRPDWTGQQRALQRLTRRRLGLSPKWLIQRRRLQEAGVRLAAGGDTVSDVASDLGCSDQAHFTRVIGMTPGQYLRLNNP